MLTIKAPNNNLKERKYVLDIVFNEFLGIKYSLINRSSNYEIILENNHQLIIKDHFFNKYNNDLDYLKLNNLPSNIKYTKNNFIRNDIPIIFGNHIVDIENSESIVCEIDIFASIFFMLSRWEEYVLSDRDIHNRFPANKSTSYINGFLNRAVVDEYIELLWNMLLFLGIKSNRRKKSSQLYITHDIDNLYKWNSWKHVARVAFGDIIKRRNSSLAKQKLSEYILIRRKKINDPYDTFDRLMDVSEKYAIKSRFYFMSGGLSEYDKRYTVFDKKCKELLHKIHERGHVIGFHPSYNTYNNICKFRKEKYLLEKILGYKIKEGRGHYLRFEVPKTWQIWDDCDMKIDSTCGYADKEGFRCGTAEEFNVFNILTRKKLDLKERPLILMDTNIDKYRKLNPSIIEDVLKQLRGNANMFTILWHNSRIEHIDDYEKIINLLYKLNE